MREQRPGRALDRTGPRRAWQAWRSRGTSGLARFDRRLDLGLAVLVHGSNGWRWPGTERIGVRRGRLGGGRSLRFDLGLAFVIHRRHDRRRIERVIGLGRRFRIVSGRDVGVDLGLAGGSTAGLVLVFSSNRLGSSPGLGLTAAGATGFVAFWQGRSLPRRVPCLHRRLMSCSAAGPGFVVAGRLIRLNAQGPEWHCPALDWRRGQAFEPWRLTWASR